MRSTIPNYARALLLLAAASFMLASCSDDDPEAVNEEEVITTMTITLTPKGVAVIRPIILQSQDLDGDGPNPPVVTVDGNLTANTTYNGVIVLLNETETPAEDITVEVKEEADEHQFFFTVSSGMDATISYDSFDGDGNPLGTEFFFEAGDASTGSLTVTLRHEPKKPNDGTLADAGGETDITQTFPLVITP